MILNEYSKKYGLTGITMLLLGIVLLVYFDLLPWWRSHIAEKRWERVNAVILSHSFEEGYEGGALSQLLYQYTYADNTFTSNRYSFERGKQLLSRQVYPEGGIITCYVNTKNPSEAVISTSFTFSPLFYVGIFMLIIGAAISISVLFKQFTLPVYPSAEEHSSANFSSNPLIKKISWIPLPTFLGRTANFKTYRLNKINDERYAYQPTWQFYFLCVFTFFLGNGLMVLSYWNFFGFSSSISWEIPFCIGLFLVTVAIAMLLTAKNIVFDKRHMVLGYYSLYNHSHKKSYVHWDKICAIQLLVDRIAVGGEAPDAFVYQMNLVLKDGKRINIVTHPSLQKIRDESVILSDFLGKIPVWDAIGGGVPFYFENE